MSDEFNRYLDLYRVGDAVQRSVGTMRVGPEDGFFNVGFPRPYTGLSGLVTSELRMNGLGAVGQPLPPPAAATLADGYVAPPAAWLQRAINALLSRMPPAVLRPLAVDGVAGVATREAVIAFWSRGGYGGPTPYLVTVAGHRTVAMPRAMLAWIVEQNLVEVAPPRPSITVTPGPVELDPLPAPSAVGGGALLLVAAAVAAGVYFSR